MKPTSYVTTVVLLFGVLSLAACAGGENPIALQPVTEADDSIQDLFTKLGDGLAAGPITLYGAVIAQGVPSKVAKKAFEKYDQFSSQVRNKANIVMIDFTQHSRAKRFFFVNRASGKVEQWTVAHGSGSDPDNDGMAQYYSNVPDSHMSSLGSYLIQEKYKSDKYASDALRTDGLESTNNNARDRAIVVHPSNYVKNGSAKQGRSWGCPAIPYDYIKSVVARAQNGTFMYIYGNNKRSAALDMRMLQQWNLVPRTMWTNESEDAPLFGE